VLRGPFGGGDAFAADHEYRAVGGANDGVGGPAEGGAAPGGGDGAAGRDRPAAADHDEVGFNPHRDDPGVRLGHPQVGFGDFPADGPYHLYLAVEQPPRLPLGVALGGSPGSGGRAAACPTWTTCSSAPVPVDRATAARAARIESSVPFDAPVKRCSRRSVA
jgi:hypothetical protein